MKKQWDLNLKFKQNDYFRRLIGFFKDNRTIKMTSTTTQRYELEDRMILTQVHEMEFLLRTGSNSTRVWSS